MPDALGLFLAAALVLVVIPGPGVLYVVARSVDQGRTAGLVSVLGVALGNLLQVVVAAAGLSAVIAASALAYNVLRVAGGLYLIWLGIARLRDTGPPAGTGLGTAPVPRGRVFRQGVVVAALNPKTALFFVAFLPQFVDPAGSVPVSLQILGLGVVFVLMALVGDATYAWVSGTVAGALRVDRERRVAELSRYGAAGVYFLLGITSMAGVRRDG